MSGENSSIIQTVDTKGGVNALIELLNHGVFVDDVKVNGKTSVEKMLSFEIAQKLAKPGSCLDSTCNFEPNKGKAPLHVAIEIRNIVIIDFLLKNGANVNLKNKIGDSPLHRTVFATNYERKQFMEEKRLIAQLLLNNGADINCRTETGQTVLHLAIRNKCIEMFQHFLQYEVDINARDLDGNTPFHCAVICGGLSEEERKHVIKLLIGRRANANISNRYGKTVLHYAAKFGNVDIVELLLHFNVDVKAQDWSGETAFHLICRIRGIASEKRKYIAELLLNKGADVQSVDKEKKTVLHLASLYGFIETVELLLQFGVDVDCQDLWGRTPLHDASKSGHGRIIQLLVHFGADVNTLDNCRNTPLHLSYEIESLAALLECGADVNLECEKNKTPLQKRLRALKPDDHDHDLIHIFVMHMVKLIAIGSFVSDKNVTTLNKSEKVREFFNKCKEEIYDMYIKTNCDRTNITYFDIFTKDINTLSKYANNEEIIHLHESGILRVKFPIYGEMISDRLCRGIKRKKLEDKATEILCIWVKKLKYDIVKKITPYLCDDDLYNIISA